MVCKEEVVSWFKDSVSYKRLDLMCTLLKMCIPFELRFLGTCLEELGKRDYTQLRDTETRANNISEVADAQSISDKHTRRKLALYLSLLHSANYGCSNILYKTLSNVDLGSILSSCGTPDDENALDELLLLYMMALNHPAFTFEQKSVFGNILVKLQDERKLSKPAVVCMKSGVPVSNRPPHPPLSHCTIWQPFYVPCTATSSDTTPGLGAAQHFSSKAHPVLPPNGLAGTGDATKTAHLPEVPAPTYFQLAPYSNAGGPHPHNSFFFYGIAPPGIPQPLASNAASGTEYHCPQTTHFVMPAMSAEMPYNPASVTSCLPSVNPDYTSPYRSPCASPYGSPVVSRSGSPGWTTSTGQVGGATYKSDSSVPLRHGSSSSSSSCSGGSTSGHRSNRSGHPRNKQSYNGQAQEEPSVPNVSEQRIPPGDEHLLGKFANMNMTNGICSGDPKQQLRDEKRHWANPGIVAVPTNNSGSPVSSQSESPSPPRSPPQEDTWDQCKEDVGRWDKAPTGNSAHPPVLNNHTGTAGNQGAPHRGHNFAAMMRRPHDLKHMPGRRPGAHMAPMPPNVYPAPQGIQPLRGSTGAIFPSPTYLFSAMMPQHTSGPASFPPFTPNGITSNPQDLIYSVPPSTQTSPPPFPVQQFAPPKTSSPPPSFMPYPPSYPPPSHSGSAKLTCFNCGGSNHLGTECHEPSIEEHIRIGQYHLDYSSPQSALEQQALSQSSSTNACASSVTAASISAPPPVHK